MFHDPELTDTVIDMNHGILHGNRRKKPLIVISAVGFIDQAAAVRLNDSIIFISAASWDHMGLIPLWKFHGNSQRNQREFPFL